MCLAVPLRIVSVDALRRMGRVDTGGGMMTVDLSLTPGAAVDGYVLVHAGAAIEALSDEDAQAILETFKEFAETTALISPRESTSNERGSDS